VRLDFHRWNIIRRKLESITEPQTVPDLHAAKAGGCYLEDHTFANSDACKARGSSFESVVQHHDRN